MQQVRSHIAALHVSEKAGTTSIFVGTIVLVVTAILFQIVAGRTLDVARFAPIGIVWTIQFIVTSVLLLPVQNLITRQLALASGSDEHLRPERIRVAVVFLLAVGIGAAFTVVTLDRFFFGDWRYVALMIAILVGRGLVSMSRGFLVGRRRFLAFGESLAIEGSTLLAAGAVVALWAPTTLAFVACIAIAPFATLIVRPFARGFGIPSDSSQDVAYQHPRGFLEYLILATGASQLILASAPVVVGLIGGSAVAVSIVFATFTLFRGPVTSAYNLVARVLPDFTEMVRDGRVGAVRMWSGRITVGGLVLAVAGFVGGWVLGPLIVAALFGPDFRPSNEMAALVGAGVGAGLGALFVGQIYIAQGRTRLLAFFWIMALTVSVLVVMVPAGSPERRVALAFAAGELVALLLLWVGSGRESNVPDPASSAIGGSTP